MRFEWDGAKAAANERKHGVRFVDAARVFTEEWHLTELDIRHDYGEERWVTIGMFGSVLLTVVTVERHDATRIISAWKANRHEREEYHYENHGRLR